jgi:acyl-coenzyme A thioesterase PaaI-like protein
MTDGPGSFATFPSFHQRDGELSEGDKARVRLAATMRALMREAFMSEAAAAGIDAVVEALEEARASLARTAVEAGSAASESHFSDRSPMYGAMNPLSMPMVMGFADQPGEFGAVTGEAVFTELYEGPPGHCHGGYVAAAFDEVLGMAQSLTGRPGMTGKLNITYRSPTPLRTPIMFTGWVERVDGRKIFTRGTAHNGGTLCAEAEGLFLSMPAELIDRLRKGRDIK